MININLLPAAQRRPPLQFDRGLFFGLMLLGVIVLAIIIYDVYATAQINALNAQITQEQQLVNQEQLAVNEVYDLRDQAEQLRAKADLLERIKQSPLQTAEILTDLANDTPRGVWITNVQLNHPPGAGGNVVVQGRSSQLRELADFMLNLDGSPIFGDATLTSSQQLIGQSAWAGGNVTFNVTGQLNAAVVGPGSVTQ